MDEKQAREILQAYAARYAQPDVETDIVRYATAQLKRGICIVHDRWHDGRIAVIAFGDRFTRSHSLNDREVTIVYEDGTDADVKVKALDFIIGCTRRIYWPPGVRDGGSAIRMHQHLSRRWSTGR